MEVQVDPSGQVCGNDVHSNAVNVAIDGTWRSWHGRHEAARARPCDALIPNTRSIPHHARRTQVELLALACDRLGTEDVAERMQCCWTHGRALVMRKYRIANPRAPNPERRRRPGASSGPDRHKRRAPLRPAPCGPGGYLPSRQSRPGAAARC